MRQIQRLRFAPKPVVVAPFGHTLGLGVELCLAAAGVCAEGETTMGLVEVGVGLIPGAGGCKEMVRRVVSPPMRTPGVGALPHLRRVFDTLGQGKVSGSAAEARELGYLADGDRVILGARPAADRGQADGARPGRGRLPAARARQDAATPPGRRRWRRCASSSISIRSAATSPTTTPRSGWRWRASCAAATSRRHNGSTRSICSAWSAPSSPGSRATRRRGSASRTCSRPASALRN